MRRRPVLSVCLSVCLSARVKPFRRKGLKAPSADGVVGWCRPLPAEGKQLLWKFRFSLKEDRFALTKFLKCVDWGDAHEAKQVPRPRRRDSDRGPYRRFFAGGWIRLYRHSCSAYLDSRIYRCLLG